MIDTHAHLDQTEFDADRNAVLSAARAAGVEAVVVIGVSGASSAACVALAEQHPGFLYAAVGVQPNYTHEATDADWDLIVSLARSGRAVALGETGLDRYWTHVPIETQRVWFDRHLRLAQELNLPFVVHTRESDADVLEMLREAAARGPLRGVMHSFTGTAETAAECVALGLHISFAGMVTFKKSDALRQVAVTVPPDRILIETDSPYLSPHPLRGRRNEPAHLVHTATCLAAQRGVTVEAFDQQTTANARALFRLPG
ncbi:MAG: TatD family hydrolase [Planctomycetes bacterium]|nr:TatD family hydrolase [Planctomycetota bacterium]